MPDGPVESHGGRAPGIPPLRRIRNHYQSSAINHYWSDAVRMVRDREGQRDLWRDYRETRRAAAALRNHAYPTDGPRFLIMSLNDWPYKTKIEALLGIGLRLAGWRPVVLARSRADRWALRYFRALGFEEFCFLDDYPLSADERWDCQAEASRFFDNADSFSAVKEWSYRGCWIGPQVLASASRKTREGSPDPNDPRVAALIRRSLPEVLARVRTAEKIMDDVQPSLAYVMEPNYDHNGPLTDTAVNRGTNLIHVAAVARDDAFMFRKLNPETRRGHPSSISEQTFAKMLAEPWGDKQERELAEVFEARYGGKWFLQSRNQGGDVRLDRADLMGRLGLDPGKKVAAVFSHVLWDANLFYGEDLFEDYGDWFLQTVKAAVANPRVNWLIKLHPANVWKRSRENVQGEMAELRMIREEIGELPPHVKLLRPDFEVSNVSLFDLVDYAVTVRGTVSTELPCFGVPVFTAGTGRCHGLGFTIDSASREEYLERMARIQEYGPMSPEEVLRAKRHAHTIFLRRPWQLKSARPTFFQREQGDHPLDHNLTLDALTIDEIHRRGDLDAWARWAVRPESIDYLEE